MEVPPNTEMNDSSPAKAILTCLTVIANRLGITIDQETLTREYKFDGKLAQITAIKKTAEKIGLKAKLITADKKKLTEIAVPALAITKSGGYVVIEQINAQKVLILNPEYDRSFVLDLDKFAADWSGQVILFQRSFSLKDLSRRFNLTWFI